MPKPIYPSTIDADKTLPKISERTEVGKSQLFTIEQKKLVFANGTRTTYEAIKGGKRGAVLVIAINENNEMLLIREYCGGRECYELAFPKGKIEQHENIHQSANRELQEETGFRAEHITFLKTVSIAPGYMGHITHILLAEKLSLSPLEGDEPEAIEVYPWPIDDIDGLVRRDDFSEARSITALYLALDMLKKKNLST